MMYIYVDSPLNFMEIFMFETDSDEHYDDDDDLLDAAVAGRI